jgi:hypothetical protein
MYAGLCETCLNAIKIPHPKGHNSYWKCCNKMKPKYPDLPVTLCDAYIRDITQTKDDTDASV